MQILSARLLAMIPVSRQIHMVASGLWRFRWLGLSVAWAVALVGMLTVALMSDRYEASARLYVDTQTVLKPLMQGLAFQPDTDQEVRMLARTLISRPNIERLMARPEIGMVPADQRQRDQMVRRLMDKIQVAPSGAGNLYAITYKDTDPARARLLVEGLVNMFVSSSADNKKRDSDQASEFIEAQIQSYEAKLVAAENRLKEFKVNNFGVSGVRVENHFERLSRLSDEVSALRVELGSATRSRDVLRAELSTEDPQLPAAALLSNTPPQESELDLRLKAQQSQLDDLLRRYTDQHPDVQAAQRTLAQLIRQKNQKAAAEQMSAGRGAATSPVFQRLRITLAEAEANVASLQSKLAAQQSQLEQTRATANRVPQVEAEFAQLNRDYDVLHKNYEQMVSRREAAQLGVKIDNTTQIADFKLVEPASVGPVPVFPSRQLLAVLSLLAALVAGLATAHAAALARPTFFDEQSLRAFTMLPLLGSVSALSLPAARERERADDQRFGRVLLALILVCGVFMLWLFLRGNP